jgi:16S rRNA (cytosine1402-N4)-methyltransferase
VTGGQDADGCGPGSTSNDDTARTMRSPSTGTVEDSSSALFPAGLPGILPGYTSPVEGLRMVQAFEHQPVMVTEVVDAFAPVPAGTVVDATVGGGGHASALLRAFPRISVLGIDRDPDAVAAASLALAPFGDRARVRHAVFGDLGNVVAEEGVGPLAGVLVDLGVSSPQIDRAERGFSYRQDGPLDMRMDPDQGASALDLVNGAPEAVLAELFAAHGESRFARRIARALVAARPLTGTLGLAEVVSRAVPAAARRRGHPAGRVFQALRVSVNDELGQLEAFLPVALELLMPGGRCLAISYHSGEDRLVKAAFARAASGGCTCPPGLPCVCGARAEHRLVFRGSRGASAEEVAANRRADSARLRVVERLPA